ncbi:glycosyltransferase [Streptomyces cinnamoneus]|uniref:glycosyltransferase n=1 Tax=Streptomyces cinnamoneus TaxID=53446 RepID=UPI0037A44C22
MLKSSPYVRRWALVVAVVSVTAAVAQQLLIIAGFGGWLPGWQPWPCLLLAVPSFLIALRSGATVACPAPLLKGAEVIRRVPVGVCVLGVLVLTAFVWASLQEHEPHFGHEEAVYANKARSWLEGTPDAGWGLYRPVGLPALGYVALTVHNSVGTLRVVALCVVLFTLTVTYVVAARWTTPRRAVVVTLLLLGGLGFLRRVPEFLNDIGSTGLLLMVVFLVALAQEKPRSRAVLGLPFVIVPAFYFRYGVVGNLLAVFLAALVAYGPRAWAAQWRRLLWAALLVALGLVPHLVHAVHATGSPLGVMTWATSQANRAFFGDGLLYYVATFPYRLAGDLGAVVMVAGILALVAAVRRVHSAGASRTEGSEDRRRVFLGLTALFMFVVLGCTSHGEPRFVYVPVVLLTVLGVQNLAERSGRWSAQTLTAVGVLASLSVLVTAQVVGHGAMRGPSRLSESTVPVARSLTSDRPCLVVSGYEPEMGWYSGCDAVTYAQYEERAVPPDMRVTLVLFERGRLQPGPTAVKELVGDREVTTSVRDTDGSLGTARAITFREGRRP